MSLADLTRRVQRRVAELQTYEQLRREAMADVVKHEERSELYAETSHVLRTVCEAIQHEAYGKIEGLVTHALRYVFEDDYTFRVVTAQKRGRVEAAMLVEKDGIRLDPLTECGGGVVDVVSFTLRLLAVTSDAANRKMLILDEPFRFLSASYRPRAAQLLRDLVSELDFQLLMVTHDTDFQLGTVIHV